ncbi:MAG: hypothetical protein COA86_11240 [Kangiella sp.]|nr:MAG: hypothetical protein COA86_11240 [Kangiella sp.]
MNQDPFYCYDFHDARVICVVRKEDIIEIAFENAGLNKEHSQASGKYWDITKGVLLLHGVTDEEAIFWSGNQVSETHPAPQIPIDLIMKAEYVNGVLRMEGFLKDVPWYTWNIKTNNCSVNILEKIEVNN